MYQLYDSVRDNDVKQWQRNAGAELRSLRRCKALQELHLKGCYRVGDAGLAALGALKSLTLLNLHECWQVTAGGLLSLSGPPLAFGAWRD